MTSPIIASALVQDRQKPGQYRHIQLPDAGSVARTCQMITHWWDLDHTLLLTDVEPRPAFIETTHNPYVHPDVRHRQESVLGIITKRHSTMAEQTIAQLKEFALCPDVIIFNPEKRYDPEYLYHWISKILHISRAFAFISEDALMQHRCCGWWPASIITVGKCMWGGV